VSQGGPLQDLREILREKAEGHSQFYKRLSEAALAASTGPLSKNTREMAYDSGGEHDDTVIDYAEEICRCHAKSTMILEAQYEDLNADQEVVDSFPSDGRRLSTLSNCEDLPRARRVRTPSVVVSDYSDDIHVGIGTEEIEYLRKKAEAHSPSSGRSSCGSLDSRRGSTSSLDCDRLSCPEPEDRTSLEPSPATSDIEDGDSGLGPTPSTKKVGYSHYYS
jgi:hypothetical protein